MSDREFEIYLSLLSRFLRLKPEQRDEIADELRDHLQQRLDELTRAGMPREDAVQRALEEFGDASELAAHFTRIARERKRRLIMRFTMGSIAATAAAILVAMAFWPRMPAVDMPVAANAQQPPQQAPPEEKSETDEAAGKEIQLLGLEFVELARRNPRDVAVEEKLDEPVELKFVDTPLEDALQYIAEAMSVDILVSNDAAHALQELITVVLNHTDIAARTALELVLERYGLTFAVRDGFVWVLLQDQADRYYEPRVYNCRDLISDSNGAALLGGKGLGGGLGGGFGGGLGGGGGFGGGGVGRAAFGALAESGRSKGKPRRTRTSADALIDLIISATSAKWEQVNAEGGTITEFNGLLVVRHSQATHREIERLLKMLRAADAEKEQTSVAPVYEKTLQFEIREGGDEPKSISGSLGKPRPDPAPDGDDRPERRATEQDDE